MIAGLLVASIVIQILAALQALRLVRLTRRRLAWVCVCCALLLMTARRCISLYEVIAGTGTATGSTAPLFEALVSIGISVAMLAGVALIAPVFRAVRRSEEEIRRREEDLQVTLGSIADGVLTTDTLLRVARMNPAARQLTGWSLEGASGRPIPEILPLEEAGSPGTLLAPFGPVIDEGRTILLPGAVLLRGKGGDERKVECSGAPIRDRKGGIRGAVIVVRDVTRQQRIEEHLRHAQKLETVGRLAGGIAHDFNNALCGILGYAELLELKTEDQPQLREYARTIAETARHSRELTSRLLTFSRKGRVVTRPVDVHESVRLVADLLERTLDRDLRIDLRLEARQTTLLGDASQIHNALLNLGVNARDATPPGGRITFATRNVAFDQVSEDGGTPIPPGRYVEVDVEDTGSGMGPEVMAHLFEPFFTTKPPGQGTGLGLSAVYGVVRDHQGVIRVESRPGEGSAFRVFLPLAEGQAPVEEPARAQPGSRCLGTVLVADDDKILRRLGAELLGELGYEVVVAEDGLQAVEAFRQRPGGFDVVLMDMVMPRMNGLDALREIRRTDPKARVVFMSGYETEVLREGLREEAIDGFLQKPYGSDELARCLAEAIGRR